MSLSPSLGIALGTEVEGSSPAAVNPNLLTWTEQFDNAAWVKTATVTPDAGLDPLGGMTADQLAFSDVNKTVEQASLVGATAGSGIITVQPASSWQRFSVTTALDTGTYTFSIWLLDPLGLEVRLSLLAAGGVAVARLLGTFDEPTVLAWGAKLEAGGEATGTAETYGARTT